jgi:hypothetical protein
MTTGLSVALFGNCWNNCLTIEVPRYIRRDGGLSKSSIHIPCEGKALYFKSIHHKNIKSKFEYS